MDINDANVVVGTSYTDKQVRHAFRYDHATRQSTDIHEPGFSESQAWSINNRSEVVGYAEALGVEFAVIWRPGEKVQKLIELVVDAPKSLSITRAYDINGKGEIVVSGRIGQDDRSFLLTPA